ncbi:hypothetical protein CTI14_51460 [Methylobacterium radiotolerans]|nr:hypothetical protein CTI14_51460 [Methylobacterium radiotolerans]
MIEADTDTLRTISLLLVDDHPPQFGHEVTEVRFVLHPEFLALYDARAGPHAPHPALLRGRPA